MLTAPPSRRTPGSPAVPVDCAHCPIAGLTVCQPFHGPQLDIVQTFKLGDRILPAGSPLYAPGQELKELYNLLNGWVLLYRVLESGRRQILDLALPGSFIGYQPDLHLPMLHGAECLTDVALCVFPRKPFDNLGKAHPSLLLQLARLNSQELIRTQDHLTNVGSRPALKRIAHLLCEILRRLNGPHASLPRQVVSIPLTQTHIADALGLTSVYVSKTLRQFKKEGVLVFRRGRLTILNPGRLAELAELEPS